MDISSSEGLYSSREAEDFCIFDAYEFNNWMSPSISVLKESNTI